MLAHSAPSWQVQSMHISYPKETPGTQLTSDGRMMLPEGLELFLQYRRSEPVLSYFPQQVQNLASEKAIHLDSSGTCVHCWFQA